jgi:hypothetical protein
LAEAVIVDTDLFNELHAAIKIGVDAEHLQKHQPCEWLLSTRAAAAFELMTAPLSHQAQPQGSASAVASTAQ